MSSGETEPQHAERQTSNVSSDASSRSHGEHRANGAHGPSTNEVFAEAGPSQPRSAVGGRPSSPQREDTPKAPLKRRRLDAELAFSSPGPAFQLQQGDNEAQEESNGTSGRARRPRRSAVLTNGAKVNGGSEQGGGRPRNSLSSRKSLSGDVHSVTAPTSSGEAYSKIEHQDQEEIAQREINGLTGSRPSDRSRSRSKSVVKSEPKPDQDLALADEVVVPVFRPKPQITPVAALDPQTPLPAILERRRKEKVARAQSDLEDVHDNHDMLVRELFHLTKFVTMVGYDPEVARNDQSVVFTTFKNAHDLTFSLDESGSGASTSTSGRVTRRRVNALMEGLALKRPQPPSKPSTPTASAAKANAKQRAADSNRGRRSSSVAGAKSPGSESNDDSDQDTDERGDLSDSSDEGAKKGKGKGKAPSNESRRKSLGQRSQKRGRSVTDEISSDTPAKRSGPRKSKALDELDDFILRHQPRPLPDHPPPLHFLAPHQIPVPRRFGGDLDALWRSFNLLQDGESGQDPASIEEADLQAYIKLDERWRSGLPMHPEAGATTRHVAHKAPRTKSHHDHLMEAVGASYSQMRQFARLKQQNSRKVARIVAQHWERQLGTSEREKKAEERRLRALAKWTLREVLKQWRLAVNVVRARKAAAEKAEKEKMDKEQLNAILEQSTAMLKKQHEVMTRADEYDSDSDIGSESDRTRYGTEEVAEVEELDVEDETREASSEPDNDNSHDVESLQPTSASITRDQSPSSTPAAEDVGDRLPGSPDVSTPAVDLDQESSAQQTPVPRSTRKSRRSARGVVDKIKKAKDSKLDPDDVDFDGGPDADEQEDAELERQMWEEDEEDDSEDAGLAADADIPIEELLKRYGYGQDAEAEVSGDEAGHEDQAETPQTKDEAMDKDAEMQIKQEKVEEDAADQSKSFDAEDEEMATEEASESVALIRRDDDLIEDHSDTESAATSGRRSSRRSMTRASSIVSSDRQGARSRQPFLLRGQLRPYQQIGFEWLASLYANGVNGILADEMGLGKTIQTISLLAHLACDKGVWGPHLVVAPTSVMLNWEVEFKKFLPGFKILSYYGNQKERKEKRIGWNTENSFNVCITSYQLVLADQHIFRRKPWVYLVLDEAHHIKNFRSQRWQTLLGFNSQRRLLLTGTPLQNNLMDLWSLMYFLMPHGVTELPGGGAFANMKDFQDWFSNPLDKAIEGGTSMNEETRAMVQKLHAVLRPYLLRRLKSEVEKELPSKYEHVITCRLSKRQRFLYNDFMSRAKTRESLASGNYLSIINCLMQLRKVCNHPDLFEVRPIVTSFAMSRSVVADYEIKDLLVRRRLLHEDVWDKVDLDVTNFRITGQEEHLTAIESRDLRRLNAAKKLPYFRDEIPERPELDTWTVEGFAKSRAERSRVDKMESWKHAAYINQYRCTKRPIYGSGLIKMLREAGEGARLEPLEQHEHDRKGYLDRCDNLLRIVSSRSTRRENMQPLIDRFAFVTPRAVATDMPRWALPGFEPYMCSDIVKPEFDTVHPVAVKLHIAFPDASLLQYDCGKLQQLDILMRRLKEGGHRILIFTQMTRVLDILESFLNYHGYRYLRLDGATKVEQRQALTEKFNRDLRISAFILSTRSGGLGINLTGADTVLFYDLDWNAAIEAQCMDRAHRIGQTRDVHIYRFVTEHTIEENMLRKANQKRLLDSVVIQQGEFNTDTLAKRIDWRDMLDENGKLGDVEVEVTGAEAVSGREVERAFLEAEDEEDRQAAVKAREEMFVDDTDFEEANQQQQQHAKASREQSDTPAPVQEEAEVGVVGDGDDEEEDEGGTIDDYMLAFVERDWDFFG